MRRCDVQRLAHRPDRSQMRCRAHKQSLEELETLHGHGVSAGRKKIEVVPWLWAPFLRRRSGSSLLRFLTTPRRPPPHPRAFSIFFSRGETENLAHTREGEPTGAKESHLPLHRAAAVHDHVLWPQVRSAGRLCEYWCLFAGGKVGSEAIQTFWSVWPTRSKDRSPAPETQQERARGGVRGPCSSDVCPPCLVLVGSIAHVLVVLGQTSGFSHLVQWCPCGVVDPAARHKRASV